MPEHPAQLTAQLTVHTGEASIQLPITPGQSVREILDASPLRVRAACGGTGACGACLVRWLSGPVNPPALAEYQKLSPEDRAGGMRLACQARPRGDAQVALEEPAPPSPWRSLPAEDLVSFPDAWPKVEEYPLALAVDLGTSHIRLSLWDRYLGHRIASRQGANPQGVFGADVLNRLEAARTRPERAAELAELARHAIVEATRDILARDVGEVTPMLAQIGQVRIVGNTAMLALLTGTGIAETLDPDNWERPLDIAPRDPATWHEAWRMPHARIVPVPPLAGFIGSDLLVDLLATGLAHGPAGALLLDVGTNSEIALWDGNRLVVTSVPGGPAFEGVGIRHGMPAEPGAILRVRHQGDAPELEVMGGGPARGYCGSGLVDAIALLRRQGVLKASGRFAVSPGPEGLALDPGQPASALTGADVDLFQRAKAALAAAMASLLAMAGMDWDDLGRIVVCGAFGRTLDPDHARALGLLPPTSHARLETLADASLAGCEAVLLAPEGDATLADLARQIQCINLARVPDFDNRFIDNLPLKPLGPLKARPR